MNEIENKTQAKCIDACNELLRGERSAVETYEKAIAKFEHQQGVNLLIELKSSHEESVEQLKHCILEMDGEPSETSGAWGGFANAIQASANFFGKNSAVEALLRGETHGESMYEEALRDPAVMEDANRLINEELLPRVRRDIKVLESIEDDLSSHDRTDSAQQ